MAPKQHPIVIVGAGVSGIAMACQLKLKLGFEDIKIFDKQGGVGGTWYINSYPGVACDIPALFYSYSFAPNYSWTSFFPPGSEILAYLVSVTQKFGIANKIELNTEVSQARWLSSECVWELTLTRLVTNAGNLSFAERAVRDRNNERTVLGKEIIHTKILVSCVGGLVEPNAWPSDIPGLQSFEGDIFHSARWNHSVDLTGKRVVVIGTGCSAAQFVPKLTKPPYNAKHVTQLMRSPPWVFPRPQTPDVWRKYSPSFLKTIPGLGRTLRFLLFLAAESNWLQFGLTEGGERRRSRFQTRLRNHLKKAVPIKYQYILEPRYSVGCKRIIIDDAWFKCLSESTHDLTTRPLLLAKARSVILGTVPDDEFQTLVESSHSKSESSVEEPADLIILANGFDTSSYLHSMSVIGIAGKTLHEVWDERGGPQAYLGTALDGFPNFFLVLGPNTLSGHSSAILASENLVSYALNFIASLLREEASIVDVKKEAVEKYTKDVQQRSKEKVWVQCSNWYTTATGWNSSVCPYSQITFTLKCMFPVKSDWVIVYTEKGRKRSIQRLWSKIIIGVTVCTVAYMFFK